MLCPNCHLETPLTKPRCQFCGAPLDVSRGDLARHVSHELRGEREEHNEARARQLLALGAFLFALTLGATLLLAPPTVAVPPPAYPVVPDVVDAESAAATLTARPEFAAHVPYTRVPMVASDFASDIPLLVPAKGDAE